MQDGLTITTTKTERIAIYGRVSTDAQTHDSQLREVRAYVRRRWPKGKITEYLDKASGAKCSREGLDSLMAEVRKGRVDVIAVYKLDRLGRSLQHLAQLLGEFATHRTALVATSQGIDTSESNPAGRLQMHVLAAVAEFERDVIRDRVKAGIAAAQERGTTNSGKPWTIGRPRTLDKHRRAVAKLMKKGLSGRQIAAKLSISPGSVFAVMGSAKPLLAQPGCQSYWIIRSAICSHSVTRDYELMCASTDPGEGVARATRGCGRENGKRASKIFCK